MFICICLWLIHLSLLSRWSMLLVFGWVASVVKKTPAVTESWPKDSKRKKAKDINTWFRKPNQRFLFFRWQLILIHTYIYIYVCKLNMNIYIYILSHYSLPCITICCLSHYFSTLDQRQLRTQLWNRGGWGRYAVRVWEVRWASNNCGM